MVLCFIFRGAHIYLYMSHFMSKLSNYNCLFIIPDILVLITGHSGLFKTPTLKLGEAGKTQTPSQSQRLRKAKTDFKSVRKTICALHGDGSFGFISKSYYFMSFLQKVSKRQSPQCMVQHCGDFFAYFWQWARVIKVPFGNFE